MRVVVRADASKAEGIGHAMRCRSLARELREAGAQILFISAELTEEMQRELSVEFLVATIDPNVSDRSCQCSSSDVQQELCPICQEKDALSTYRVMKRFGFLNTSWIMVDSYRLGSVWHEFFRSRYNQLKAECAGLGKILVIDDLANRPLSGDLILNPSLDTTHSRNAYKDLAFKESILLLGRSYSLVDKRYRELRAITSPRVSLRRVLIFFGGGDYEKYILSVLGTFSDPSLEEIQIDIVVASQNDCTERIKSRVKERRHAQLYVSLPTLADLVSNADIAVGGGGSTTWERACLGLPCITVIFSNDQRPTSEILATKQLGWLLDKEELLRSNALKDLIHSIRGNPSELNQTSIRLSDFIDGLGTARVVERMISLSVPSDSQR